MMRSLFAGISGLQTHQTRMDVISNNIANVNTMGFKGSRVTFKEALNQTIKSAGSAQTTSRGQVERGGINPQQIGLGVGIATIDVIHSQGAPQPTSSATDLAIEGSGFFIVSDGEQNFYTRAGMFDFDETGTLVSKTNGFVVMGYLADAKGNIVDNGGDPVALQIPADRKELNPVKTSTVNFSGNIDANLENGDSFSRVVTIYDSLGNTHRIILKVDKKAENEWEWQVYFEEVDPSKAILSESKTLSFTQEGVIQIGDPDDYKFTISKAYLPGIDSDQEITFNFEAIRQHAEETSMVVRSQDGLPAGSLDSIAVDPSGVIVGSYTNGLTRNLGQVVLARFENPGGLLKVGDTLFAESVNSGQAQPGTAGSSGFGSIMSNTLEMSNVDLSEEFTNMIITQRGFQANSRVITSADEMLQELVNLKR